VTSNISPIDTTVPVTETRATLTADVVGELTSWNPREWTRALRHWHRGSISLVHLDVLMVLEEAGQLSMGRLAELLDVSVASATGIVGRMEKRGLVERHHDDEDRRIVLVQRSPAGEQVFGDIDEHRRTGLTRLLATMSDDELRALRTGHRALHAARQAYVASEATRATAEAPGAPRETR
jgi:DNA-binding MarR family transcriptional regulator